MKMIRDTLPRVVVGRLIKVRRLVVQDGIQGGRGVTLCQSRGKCPHRQCQGGQHLANEHTRRYFVYLGKIRAKGKSHYVKLKRRKSPLKNSFEEGQHFHYMILFVVVNWEGIGSMNVAADVHHRRNCAYRGWLAIVGQIVGRRLEARTLARNTKHLAFGILSPTIVSLLVFVTMMANGEKEGFLVREKSILRCTGSKLRRDGISRDGM